MTTVSEPATDLRMVLHTATAGQHRSLDTQPRLQRLLSRNLTLDDYIDILRAFGRAFRVVEPVITETGADTSGLRLPGYLSRTPAIEKDLAALDASIPGSTAEYDTLPRPTYPDGPFTPLGIRYVVEGSTQGSVHILRRLEQTLPELHRLSARRYWDIQMRAAEQWETFCNALHMPCSDTERDQAVAGARWAFAAFTAQFSR